MAAQLQTEPKANRPYRIVNLVLLVLIVVGSAVAVRTISVEKIAYQWDFKVYYVAPLAAELGMDAYDPYALNLRFGSSPRLPFVYPPFMLKVFRAVSLFDVNAAYQFWLFLRVGCLLLLLWMWRRYFLSDGLLGFFLVFALLSFDSAMHWDFKAGNIGVFEQLILWSAFLAFIRNRLTIFCGLIVIATFIKLSPILFLGLLLFLTDRHRWLYLGGSLVSLAALFLTNYLIWPEMSRRYLANIMSLNERGIDSNFSTLALFKDIGNWLSLGGSGNSQVVAYLVYLLIVTGVLVATYLIVRKNDTVPLLRDRRLLIFLAIVLFAVVVPRMKSYSYLLLIVPSYALMREYLPSRLFPWLFVLMLVSFRSPFPLWETLGTITVYYPLFLAYLVLGLYLIYVFGGKRPERYR